MDPLIIVGPHWKGYSELKHLIVFGASYCEVGYGPHCPPPSAAAPLGVAFPGQTYAEHGSPNWVGHLAREFCPSGAGDTDPLLVYDYARGGQMVSGVHHQVENQFLPTVGQKPNWAPWSAEDTLFATWVGINDCGSGCDPAEAVQRLFQIETRLHENGARNFMLVNLPPMLRSPAAQSPTVRRKSGDPYRTWNACLRASARAFATMHADATVLVFSAWNLFDAVLDAPVAHGFASGDSGRIAGGIWVDQLHPTSKMHRLVARSMSEFLRGVQVGAGAQERQQFLLLAPYLEDEELEQRRNELEGEHVTWIDKPRKGARIMKYDGPLTSPESTATSEKKKIAQTSLIIEAISYEAAREIVEANPFYTGEVWDKKKVVIMPFESSSGLEFQ